MIIFPSNLKILELLVTVRFYDINFSTKLSKSLNTLKENAWKIEDGC